LMSQFPKGFPERRSRLRLRGALRLRIAALEERLSASRSVKGGMRIAEFGMRNNKNYPEAKIRKEGVT